MEAKWCIPVTMVLLVVVVSGDSEGKEAAAYQPLGFGTTGGKLMGQKEGIKVVIISGGYGVATGGPLAWGLCYDKEMSPSKLYCDDYYEYAYPCTPGVSYHGRVYKKRASDFRSKKRTPNSQNLKHSLTFVSGASIYRNYSYGKTGEALQIDLLNHPEFIENNATLAFQAAIWKWMTPGKKHQPSAHDAFVGIWKPTKNDTLAKRVPGFGTTMNVLYGDEACGKGDDESMNNIVSHYL
uniref:Glycoside hydrolase family 19 catalytic domain-containing protein n=1 Tax=Salix viminalis TaxID=40686 RepID=A0A6N2LV60_SALVM